MITMNCKFQNCVQKNISKIHNTERQDHRLFSHLNGQKVPPTTSKTVEGTF